MHTHTMDALTKELARLHPVLLSHIVQQILPTGHKQLEKFHTRVHWQNLRPLPIVVMPQEVKQEPHEVTHHCKAHANHKTNYEPCPADADRAAPGEE